MVSAKGEEGKGAGRWSPQGEGGRGRGLGFVLEVFDWGGEFAFSGGVDHLLGFGGHFDSHLIEALFGPAAYLAGVSIGVGAGAGAWGFRIDRGPGTRSWGWRSVRLRAPSRLRDRTRRPGLWLGRASGGTVPGHGRTAGIGIRRWALAASLGFGRWAAVVRRDRRAIRGPRRPIRARRPRIRDRRRRHRPACRSRGRRVRF